MHKTVIACVLALLTACSQKTHVVQDTKPQRMLYVLTAESGMHEKEQLTLKNVRTVIYFSDRPTRLAGHISLKKFAKKWSEKKEWSGALSLIKENSDAILTLVNPQVEGDMITFTIKDTKGSIPKIFTSSSLFVDMDTDKCPEITLSDDLHSLDCTCADY